MFRERFPGPDELEEIYRQSYLKEKIYQDSTNQESGEYATQSYANYLRQNLINSSGRLLDYGAGSGALVSILRSIGVNAEGVEFSESARDYCLNHRGFSLKKSLRGVPDGYFHVVSMIEVIEHLTDLNGTLREIHRVLAPGGKLVVATPSRHGLRARIERGYWREAKKKFHLFLFDWRSLHFHLQHAGFVDVKRNHLSPLQKAGWRYALYSRVIQTIGLSGTLFVIARK